MSANKWNKKYNQRQRKKMRIGEYQELVFVARAKLALPMANDARDIWMDEFIQHAIEVNGLLCAAGLNDAFWCHVVHAENRQSVTEQQRAAVTVWLSQRVEIIDLEISPLFDANIEIKSMEAVI